MSSIRRVEDDELALARDLHNRFTDQDRSVETVRSWYQEVPRLFLFAVESDGVIGVCTGRPRSERSVELAGLGVESNRRGEGVGSRLLERFEENADEIGTDRISVASAGGRVDDFYVDNGYEPQKILVMNPAGEPGDYAGSGFDVEWTRHEDGSWKCYVDVAGYNPTVLETVRDEFGDTRAIYVMGKDLTER